MRRFKIYLYYPFSECPSEEDILEFDDDTTDEQIKKECADCLDNLIANNLDTGWYEMEDDEE